MCPSKTTDGSARGYIIPIGGAEEKFDNPEILDRFVEICGGKDARISIIPTASELEDTGRNYEKLFRTLGIKHAEHMIAGGLEGSMPTPDMVTMAPGLGLTNNFIIDQHFRQRDRLGRLLTALAYNPFAVGIGLDEDTAAFIRPGDDLEVVGSGGITIIDPSELSHSSMDSARRGEPVSLINVKLHTLISGGRFTISSREASSE